MVYARCVTAVFELHKISMPLPDGRRAPGFESPATAVTGRNFVARVMKKSAPTWI